jgi:hypothetical protein
MIEEAEITMSTPSITNFLSLPEVDQDNYRTASGQMTNLVRSYVIPIAYGPPVIILDVPMPSGETRRVAFPRTPGKLETASGCIFELGSKYFVATAEHVLDSYKKRADAGEQLHWQVGKLPPFDPLRQVVWRGSCKFPCKDIVFLNIDEEEAIKACAGRTNIVSLANPWPPRVPEVGETVLLGGFPRQLREVQGDEIALGPFSALLKVTTSIGDGTFKCRFKYEDLISFNERPLPVDEIRACTGGVSGGPVLSIGALNYPLVGVISQAVWDGYGDCGTIVVESMDGVPNRL